MDAYLNFPFPASITDACLRSLAIDNNLAAGNYVEFRSTLAYLESKTLLYSRIHGPNYYHNLPSDYYYPATDIIGGLNKIKSQAAAGGFSGQYEFDLALNKLLYSAHDGHLKITACTSQAIQYYRELDIENF